LVDRLAALPKATVLTLALAAALAGQEFPAPSSLPKHDGLPELPSTAEAWNKQRDRLKESLAHYQYGRLPPKPESSAVTALHSQKILGGSAVQQRFRLILKRNGESAAVDFGVVRPVGPGRRPVVIKNDRYLFSTDEIEDPRKRKQYAEQERDEVDRWVFAEAVSRGWAVVKFNREHVARDRKDSHSTGVFKLYPEYDWATIAAWAWFYQPLIDHLLEQEWVDADRIAVTGHSRGGKTALCAGIYDERIALTVPSASGSGGAGSWRIFTPGGPTQTVGVMARNHNYWFTRRLYEFVDQAERLPFDSHTAKALIAPRGLLNTQGADDPLANPVGTRATFEAAQEIFELLGVPENQGVHWRPGGHGQLKEDWLALFDFGDRLFFGLPAERRFDHWP